MHFFTSYKINFTFIEILVLRNLHNDGQLGIFLASSLTSMPSGELIGVGYSYSMELNRSHLASVLSTVEDRCFEIFGEAKNSSK